MYNTELFKKTIPTFGSWVREPQGFTVMLKSATSFYGYKNDDVSPIDGQVRHISDLELSGIHPLFPIGLQILVRDDPLVSKNDIGELLDVWDYAALVQTEPSPDQQTHPVALSRVDQINVKDHEVRIYGEDYAVVSKALSENDEPMLIPVGMRSNLTLSRPWMDKVSPGWESRYQMAHHLGLDATYILNHMFQSEINYVAEVTPDDLVM